MVVTVTYYSLNKHAEPTATVLRHLYHSVYFLLTALLLYALGILLCMMVTVVDYQYTFVVYARTIESY
jgi:hypothetical protein